jgi:glycerophosphoryl diester phosphodiesterase
MLAGFHHCIEKALYRPVVYAHRGGSLLWPGNTTLAFDEALKAGADVLEMDVRATSDGALVVIHNSTVDETTDGSGPVAGYKLADLQHLDAGYRWGPDKFPHRGKGLKIPTLEEVFKRYRDQDVCMNIEIKQIMPSIVDRFCDLVDKHGMSDRVLVASFSTSVLRQIRVKFPQATTSAGTWEMFVFYLLHWLDLADHSHRLNLTERYHLPVQALQFWANIGPFPIITESLVVAARKYNLEIHGWTVNRKEEMRRLIKLDVDGIITDDPKLLIEEIKKAGPAYAIPPIVSHPIKQPGLAHATPPVVSNSTPTVHE